nr:unnamed protein product [Spirometra erinaceieuropaei]
MHSQTPARAPEAAARSRATTYAPLPIAVIGVAVFAPSISVCASEGRSDTSAVGICLKIFRRPDTWVCGICERTAQVRKASLSTASFFTNQGYWQVGIYTSLDHSCLSFVLAVLLWFTIPFLYSMSCGLGYLALTSASHEHIITHHEVYEGLLPYVVPTYLFGHWGQIVVYTIIAISLVSSCICNLMGIRSLLVHDVLETYIMPFKKRRSADVCLFCDKRVGQFSAKYETCRCGSMLVCTDCEMDRGGQRGSQHMLVSQYLCLTHGEYRRYQDKMEQKGMAFLLLFLAVVILAVVLIAGQPVDGNIPSAVFSAIGGPCIGSVVLPIYWARLHKSGLLLGLLGGPIIALLAWVTQAMTMEDELSTNLDSEKALFTASMTAFVAGFALPVLVTLGSTKPLTNEEAQIVWRRLQEIDNPLMPWPEVYSQELDLRYSLHLSEGKPALSEVQRALQFTKRVTQLGFCINFLCFTILCPALTMTSQILSFETLSIWITTIEIWAAAALFFCITLPVIFFTINYMENSKDDGSSVLKKARRKQRLPYRRTGNWFSRLL